MRLELTEAALADLRAIRRYTLKSRMIFER
ncbi:hypothetical protein OpiT1DRAFT_04497 [Opitutaceae bacterium TAV1]|nr:hypothetical protein OpiT1DRAFT_04497 [Opitutaceae bacterium TAV1]